MKSEREEFPQEKHRWSGCHKPGPQPERPRVQFLAAVLRAKSGIYATTIGVFGAGKPVRDHVLNTALKAPSCSLGCLLHP